MAAVFLIFILASVLAGVLLFSVGKRIWNINPLHNSIGALAWGFAVFMFTGWVANLLDMQEPLPSQGGLPVIPWYMPLAPLAVCLMSYASGFGLRRLIDFDRAKRTATELLSKLGHR